MIQFYVPDIRQNPVLPQDEARHCIKVLRTPVGGEIHVIDGKGYRYTCRLLNDNPRKAEIEIISTELIPEPWVTDITVAIAPTKNMDRMEWLTEKLTEIGVNHIIPVLCRHSERKEIKIDRLERIAVSAMKQSLKTSLPDISQMVPLEKVLEMSGFRQKFIAYCDPSIPRRLLAKEFIPGAGKVLILIGPEGDFSIDEIEHALNAGFLPVSLGDCLLRTETAALTACDTFHIINQMQ